MFQNRMMKLREPVGKTFSIVFTGDVCPKSPESRERTIHNAEELAAEKVYVRVLDQNDSYAAIEEGALDADAEVIVSETAELNEWDIVRYKE